jgi:hypothetical protein
MRIAGEIHSDLNYSYSSSLFIYGTTVGTIESFTGSIANSASKNIYEQAAFCSSRGDGVCLPMAHKAAQNPAHCQRDEALRYLVERWTELPVDTQAAILAIVRASTKTLNEMHEPPAP